MQECRKLASGVKIAATLAVNSGPGYAGVIRDFRRITIFEGNNCTIPCIMRGNNPKRSSSGSADAKEPDFYPGWTYTTHMNEMNGHYECGRWVPDPDPVVEVKLEPAVKIEPETGAESEAKSEQAAPTIEEQMQEASQSVRKAVNNVVSTGQHLFGTPEGHEHIQQAARKAGEDLERAINGWAESARRALQRE